MPPARTGQRSPCAMSCGFRDGEGCYRGGLSRIREGVGLLTKHKGPPALNGIPDGSNTLSSFGAVVLEGSSRPSTCVTYLTRSRAMAWKVTPFNLPQERVDAGSKPVTDSLLALVPRGRNGGSHGTGPRGHSSPFPPPGRWQDRFHSEEPSLCPCTGKFGKGGTQ